MGFRRFRLLHVLAFASIASVASAQDVGKPASTAGAPAPTSTASAQGVTTQQGAATTGASTDTTTTTAAAPSSTTQPSAPTTTMGYAYGDGASHKQKSAAPHSRARARVHHAAGPVATLPGFELLPEGGSRLFVELTASIQVVEKPVAGGITYILKGAHVAKRNNENALVTVHFNTPVTRARLVPVGGDLHFVVELRQNVKATWKLVPAKDGATVLQIDFPNGTYLPNEESSPPADNPPKPPATGGDAKSGAK